LYILMNTIALIAGAINILTIIFSHSLRRSQCYQMMLYICVLDSIQAFIALISGFLTIWPVKNDSSTKIAGAFFEPLWICMMYFVFLLSVNRLSIIIDVQLYKQFIITLCKFLWIFSMFIAAAFFIAFLTPNVTMRYDAFTYSWRYIRTSEAFVIAMTEACSLTPLSILSFINYIIILIAINRKKRSHSLQMSSISSSEKRILIQSIALFSLTTTGVFFDFFNFYLFPATKWMYFILNLTRQTCIVMILADESI
uniref:G-protein coupled receptors family 1 profile domain-containing protein n=1 Tax=Parascaris univalens TaxID=6257 RepID=A0A915ANT2_PARUN